MFQLIKQHILRGLILITRANKLGNNQYNFNYSCRRGLCFHMTFANVLWLGTMSQKNRNGLGYNLQHKQLFIRDTLD